MVSPSQDTPTPDTLRSRSTQDVIHQIQSELLTLIRVTPDEAIDSWQQTSLRVGDWSSTLETEISRFLW